MRSLTSVNEFVIKFANVNGTGSASANQLFAKGVFRMGVPVTARNLFPSNIQGLPTWYEVRVSEAGHLGRRGGTDIMVAMNPQSFAEDVASLEPGGFLVYDSTKPLDHGRFRDGIQWLGIPLTELCLREFGNVKQRHLFKNIAYVGALAALLGIQIDLLQELLAIQFRDKERVLAANNRALDLGHDYAEQHLPCPIGVRVERSRAVAERIFMNGNRAAGLGCVYAGATVAAWYPITPSTSLVDSFTDYCEQLRVDQGTGEKRFAIVQAEDELAAIGIAIGASWSGARAFTSTSGPGISLMAEFLGLAYFAEVPVVLFNVQRGGPSTGMPTRTQQADLLACAYASHGDTKQVLLFPANPTEAFDFAVEAFDLADRLQTPVIVMSDLDLGMSGWTTEPMAWDDSRRFDRGKVLDAAALEALADWGRYRDVDGDGICYRTYPGTHPGKGAYFTRGTSRDEYARYTESGAAYTANVKRLQQKFRTAARLVPEPQIKSSRQNSLYGLIYFGTTSAAADEALQILSAQGYELDALRIRAFPFSDAVYQFIEHHRQVFVVEQNRDGQMRTLLLGEGDVGAGKLQSILHFDGIAITARFIADQVLATLPRPAEPSRRDDLEREVSERAS